jgi:hypothetical protein
MSHRLLVVARQGIRPEGLGQDRVIVSFWHYNSAYGSIYMGQ